MAQWLRASFVLVEDQGSVPTCWFTAVTSVTAGSQMSIISERVCV